MRPRWIEPSPDARRMFLNCRSSRPLHPRWWFAATRAAGAKATRHGWRRVETFGILLPVKPPLVPGRPARGDVACERSRGDVLGLARVLAHALLDESSPIAHRSGRDVDKPVPGIVVDLPVP